MIFTNSASAGDLTSFTAQGSLGDGEKGGLISFLDDSTAASGTFIAQGPIDAPVSPGQVVFDDNAAAAAARLTAYGPNGNKGRRRANSFPGDSDPGNSRIQLANDFGGDAQLIFSDTAIASSAEVLPRGAM